MIKLSDDQLKVVNSPLDRAVQVLASAGTGKTRVLTERIRKILNETKRAGVIAITFTNKAAEEMSSRLADFDDTEERAWIGTIHSIAQRILENYAHVIGLPSELNIFDRDKDRMEVFLHSLRLQGIDIDEYLGVLDSKKRKERERNLQDYMNTFSSIKRNLLNPEEIRIKYINSPRLADMFNDYQQSLINSGGIDYDDILVYAYRILIDNDWVSQIYRAKYKYIFVDEAQDLNRVQYELIKSFCGDTLRSVFMVGDPDQTIYGFNDSSKEFLCEEFKRDFNPVTFSLKENFRSSKEVIRAANIIRPKSQKEGNFAFKGKVVMEEFDNEKSEAEWITNEINELLHEKTHEDIEGDITLDKIVVIARSKFVFPKLEQELREKRIGFYLRRGERNLEPESLFGKILDYSIKIRLNPRDWVNGKKLCYLLGINPPVEWGRKDPLEYLSSEMLNTKTSLSFPELYQSVLISVSKLDSMEPNIVSFIKNYREKLKKEAEILKAKTEVQQSEVYEMNQGLHDLDEFENSWKKFIDNHSTRSLIAFRNAMALGQLAEDINNRGIALSTVHTMRGLEKDIVFLMGMCEGVFPDYRADTQQKIEEERNNAFVAVTRAKRWLYISYPRNRVMPWGDERPQRPSIFFNEIKSNS